MQRKKKSKIFVGLSGGVDSSVSAALLKEEGHEVIGVFIKVWQADFLPCTWREERRDAMRAAAHLAIPFVTLDLEKEYKKEVVDYMIGEYGKGRVPNPDVMCNKYVKFGAFLDFAKAHSADYIATGHYARIAQSKRGLELRAGVDKEKDQSYFLWTLTGKQLEHIKFPVGNLKKKEVRKLAEKFALPNAEKKDSQGLCFMGPVDMESFLKHYLQSAHGEILLENGEVIGTHEGAMFYTIGQRHGFTTEKKSASDAPYFVTAKNIEKNTITVAHKDPRGTIGKVRGFTCSDLNFIANASEEDVAVRIRYRGALHPCTIQRTGAVATIILADTIEGIAAGQSAVFYRNSTCLGGGVIEEVLV